MKSELTTLKANTLQGIAEAKDDHTLKQIDINILGRKGQLTDILRKLKDLSPDEKKTVGKLANEVKTDIQIALENKQKQFANSELEKSLNEDWIDLTAPGKTTQTAGSIHPLSQLQKHVEEIFSEMGFSIMDGPEAESEYYNFEGLNIPKHHPARDMQDTFFLKEKHSTDGGRTVLRTHTSPVQVRTMEKYGAPLRVIVPGRVFRYEATDASHDSTFNQVEGLLVDKGISLAHLKGVLAQFLSRAFGQEVTVRFRPGYFPFVEPGLEVDFSCLICKQEGCRVCKKTGWVEFMGAGLVHPNVLKAGGIDSEVYQGWAFGFGLDRLLMMRHKIDDIRHIHGGDLRFVRQF
ncbi:phenylalanine--tRNA ligase subunit alpha [Patescibacteria group bacterium]|nr:phenylalanine--tRNA ligase subunit alpha [Patescibacteria group bacterium]